jgi:serine/threonine protein kinase
MGPAADSLLLRFLAKSVEDRFQSVEEALDSVEDLRAELVARAKPTAPSAPILAETSLLRYSADAAMSLVLFPGDPRCVQNTARSNSGHTESVHGGDSVGTEAGYARESRDLGLQQVPSKIGKYTIIKMLAQGGMGAVYLGLDENLRRNVAIKFMRGEFRHQASAERRFLFEAVVLTRVIHPNIVAIYDTGEEAGWLYTVLELIDGCTLGYRSRDRALPQQEVARLMATVARAVDYAHSRGVVHRDLKPENIIIMGDGTPKIVDFGLAKLMVDQKKDVAGIYDQPLVEGDVAETLEGVVVGTPGYMAPEQARRDTRAVGPAADIYALGATLYKLLADRGPFEGANVMSILSSAQNEKPEPPSRWHPGLSRDLDAICLKCLEKQPETRYPTAAALADDLERFLAGKAVAARPPGAWDRLRRFFSVMSRRPRSG